MSAPRCRGCGVAAGEPLKVSARKHSMKPDSKPAALAVVDWPDRRS